MTTDTPVTKEILLQRLTDLKKKIDEEAVARFRLQDTPRWKELEQSKEENAKTVAELTAESLSFAEEQRAIEATVPDSRKEFTDAKMQLIAIMRAEGLERYENAVGKFSEKKAVNGKRLLEVLGGDIDEFMSVATITQKALKDFAADRPEVKKNILSCIRVVSRDLEDVEIELPE